MYEDGGADVNAGVDFLVGVGSECFVRACARRAETARRLHIADLQTWADVQMAGAFWEGIFYFHPNNCSVTAAHQDPGYLPASSIEGHFSSLSHRSSETGRRRSLRTPSCSFLTPPMRELPPRLSGESDTTPSPVIYRQ